MKLPDFNKKKKGIGMIKTKVLFLFPNILGTRRIPLGISILSACLKKAGHITDIFDTTFYTRKDIDSEYRMKVGISKKIDFSSIYTCLNSDVKKDFIKKIKTFNPDIIAISFLQDEYYYTRGLLRDIKKETNAFIVAGGAMPTLSPKLILKNLELDAVIIGEGEHAIVELANNMNNPLKTANLAYISNDKLIQNPIAPLVPLADLPHHDYTIFNEEHLYKPFKGKIMKTGYLELTRGCLFNCTFCSNRQINALYGKGGRLRSRDLDSFILEAKNLKEKYGLQLFAFSDENFLIFHNIKEFAKKWKSSVNLPFLIQSRIEMINLEKLKAIKKAGCLSLSIGIECGNEEFRHKVLNRMYSNEDAKRAFKLCRKVGIYTTANNMIGFPNETEEHIKQTIILNRECFPNNVNITIFAPYLGCSLNKTCVKMNLIGKEEIPNLKVLTRKSGLRFSGKHKKMIKYYFNNFHRLVYQKKGVLKDDGF